MAMMMRGEVVLPADRLTVWAKLNDPDTLKNCVGLIESMERTGPDAYAFVVRVKLGPLGVAFRGRILLSHLDPPDRYRINAEGEGGLAGYAGGFADVALNDHPEGTLLAYSVEVDLGGRLARMGAHLMDGVAQKAADRFFAGFAKQCVR
jgi:uncharacterized protein